MNSSKFKPVSPTPWIYDPDDEVFGADGEPIFSSTGGFNYPEDEDAAIIAVNCHTELLAALKFYTSICGNTCHSITRETAAEMYSKATAAIAKAEGRS